jgi:hypothetical protein
MNLMAGGNARHFLERIPPMIPQPHRDNFNSLYRAFEDGAACLLECHDRAAGRPVYVICAVNRSSPDYELVPFATLFTENPYDLLSPPIDPADERGSV